MICGEIGCSIEYVMYSMDYLSFIEAYNHILMYKHGYTRKMKVIEEDKMKYTVVYDEENGNWIDYVDSEKDRYTWVSKRNCHVLKKEK